MPTKRVYTNNPDGTCTVTIEEYSVQNQIADKEAKLLEIYAEIEKLKEQL
mgnify:CR=1 FL=1